MRILLSVDVVRAPLTGIGRYVYELARHLGAEPGVEAVHLHDAAQGLMSFDALTQRANTAPASTTSPGRLRRGAPGGAYPAWPARPASGAVAGASLAPRPRSDRPRPGVRVAAGQVQKGGDDRRPVGAALPAISADSACQGRRSRYPARPAPCRSTA